MKRICVRVRAYHGTNAAFTAFDEQFKGTAHGNAPANRLGFNFTDNVELALTFGKRLIQADITLENPLVIDAKGQTYAQFKHLLNAALERRLKPHHDGVIIRRYADCGVEGEHYIEGTHYIPRSTSQIAILTTG